MKSPTFPSLAGLLGAITASQQQFEWWFRNIGTAIAIIGGILAIYRFFRPAKKRDVSLD
jgi:hypothetical protein